MEIRAMISEERIYAYRQSSQIAGQTGSMGYLQGSVGGCVEDFCQAWHDIWKAYKPEDFQTELDTVIQALRSEEYGILRSRRDMAEHAGKFADSMFSGKDSRECGFRVDEVGSELYHICQFAELMHKNGATYEPKPEERQKGNRNREQGR